jgi:hypothetical protein
LIFAELKKRVEVENLIQIINKLYKHFTNLKENVNAKKTKGNFQHLEKFKKKQDNILFHQAFIFFLMTTDLLNSNFL